MWPPGKFVDVLQRNTGALPPPMTHVSRTTAVSAGIKAMHLLIKLQRFNGNRSMETFLIKFQHMAAYLCWDDEDTFKHFCASLNGAAG